MGLDVLDMNLKKAVKTTKLFLYPRLQDDSWSREKCSFFGDVKVGRRGGTAPSVTRSSFNRPPLLHLLLVLDHQDVEN